VFHESVRNEGRIVHKGDESIIFLLLLYLSRRFHSSPCKTDRVYVRNLGGGD
jgi:hypothetical protein